MINLLKSSIDQIKSEYGEIHFRNISSSIISVSNGNMDTARVAQNTSGDVRIFDQGGWGFSSFSNPDSGIPVDQAEKNASLISQKLTDLPLKLFRGSPVHNESLQTQLKKSPKDYTLREKKEIIQKYHDILKHEHIHHVRVSYKDVHLTDYFVNTEGSRIKQEKVFTGIAFSVLAKDGTNAQNAHESVGEYGGMELIENLESKAETVKKRALDLLKAPKVQKGKYRVLLDPRLAGVFAHEAFGHLSESDFLYNNQKMQEQMKLGREFGPEFLNIIDDGTLNQLGYTPYDDEGIPGEKTYLIKNGCLSNRLHSRETASRMNEKPTGNARSLHPGVQPIVRMTNLEMFTFSSGHAYRIKNGQIREMLRDVNLTGNVFQTLKNIRAAGNDLQFHGGMGGCGKGGQSGLRVSTGSPHILIDDVLIGGE